MQKQILTYALGSLLMLANPLTSRAQAQMAAMPLVGFDPSTATYTGPRYPGGPDSLRATLRRALQRADPALVGELTVRLELDDAGRPAKTVLLNAPPGPNAALAARPEALKAVEQVVRGLLPWQLGTPLPGPAPFGRPDPARSITLVLNFGAAAPALSYSDENPTFPAKVNRRGQPVPNLIAYVQMEVRYPAQDLRSGRQGTVYAYFEVSETGAIALPHIVGSVSPSLDAEIMRVLGGITQA